MKRAGFFVCTLWFTSCASTPPQQPAERPSLPAPPACAAERADCNGLGGDGCETDLRTDLRNCGRCGLSCQAAQVSEAMCVEGACKIMSCSAGHGDCNGRSDDGCEGMICYHSHGPSCETRCDPGGDAGYGYEF